MVTTRIAAVVSAAAASVAAALALLAILPSSAFAQQIEQPKGFVLEITPYFWTFGISGELTIDGTTVPLDYSISDMLKITDPGFAAVLEVRHGNLTAVISGLYVDASEDSSATRLDFEFLSGDAFVGYRLFEHLDVMVGGRYYRLDATIREDGAIIADGKDDWLDLLVGARLDYDISRKWWVRLRSDIGGSTAGSDIAFSIRAAIYYQLLERLYLGVGYSIFRVDYEEGTHFERFAYDVTHTGPGLAVMFRLE
jgi:hypothetical protein